MTRTLTLLAIGTFATGAFTLPAAADEDADAQLRAEAYATCRGADYQQDTKIVINYKKGWFRCEWPKEYKSNGTHK